MKRNFLAAALLAALSIPLIVTAQTPGGDDMGRMHGMHGGHDRFSSNATIAADKTALDEAFTQLRTDAKAGNAAAVATDQAAITAALGKLQADRTALHTALQSNAAVQAAKAAVKADHLALERDRTQLRSDQIAGNEAAVAADKQAFMADMAKVRADMKTLADAVAAVTI